MDPEPTERQYTATRRDLALRVSYARFTHALESLLTYVFGNALLASELTVREPRAGLYVPLRLFVREVAPERTVVTYDLPSGTLDQFESREVSAVAAELDRMVAQLVADAASRAEDPALAL
jgi:Domain of unknown function DUF302